MSEQRMWAPWRYEYIKGPKSDECIFCSKPAASDDAANFLVHRGDRVFAMLNAFPYNNGHVMVAPYRHIGSIEALDDRELVELMTETQATLAALRGGYSPDGFNIGINQGKVAGAGFDEHVHMHVVPRWDGDTNFMPVVAGTHVLSQALSDAYTVLKEAWP